MIDVNITLKNIALKELDTLRDALTTARNYANEAASGSIEYHYIPHALRIKARNEAKEYDALLKKLS
jgi:hypothetical protein